MKARLAILGTALLLTGPAAQGALKAIEQAYELSLSQVSLPVSVPGQLLVRRCASCKPEALRITGATGYFIRPATAPVSLADARKAASKAARRRQASVYVYYDPKTRNVRRLVLHSGN